MPIGECSRSLIITRPAGGLVDVVAVGLVVVVAVPCVAVLSSDPQPASARATSTAIPPQRPLMGAPLPGVEAL